MSGQNVMEIGFIVKSGMGISKFLPEPFVHISYTVFVRTPLKECMEI
jgi:hypothetical protein